MSYLDLHLHTTHSDGSCTPSEVMHLAHAAGVTTVAITDHDITTGIPEATLTGQQLGIDVIPGIEISSSFRDSEFHLLGYFLDCRDAKLNDRLTILRKSRHSRNPQIIEHLRALGIEITYDEVRALAGTDSVGRPHIARMLMEKRVVASAREAFDRFLADGRPAYVPRHLPSPAEAILWIKEARGLAVLAHPTWIKATGDALIGLVRQLKVDGLDGIEAHYSSHTRRQTRDYLALARQFGLLATGGSDFHGLTKPDIKVGIGRGTLHIPASLAPKLKDAAARL